MSATTIESPRTPEPEEHRIDIRDRADKVRQLKLVVVFALAALLLFAFWLSIDHPTIRYTLGERITADEPAKDVNGKLLVLLGLVVCLVALALAAVNKVPKGAWGAVLMVAVGLAFFLGFLVWNYADQSAEGLQLAMVNPLPATIKYSVPLVLGALAGVLCERAGVINIAIEGQLLMGALFASFVASYVNFHHPDYAHSAAVGLLGGVAAGLLMAWLLGVFAMRYLVNQVVLGVVLIALATGLSSFLLSQIPDDKKQLLNNPPTLERIEVPGLSKIPVLGPTLFNQTVLVYLMYVLVIAVTFLLYQTRWGLRVRSVGEHPKAADTVGIKVNRTRWQAVLLGGSVAGLGGAFFTVGSTGAFDNNASAGNGFIALAAVIMGRWHPIGATFAALFFGFMTTLQFQLQSLGKIPSELLLASPYLATIIAVAGFVGRVRPPAADGEPYVKG